MPRFFVPLENLQDGVFCIKGEDAHHIARSLRMAVGEHITVCDMQKDEYDCVLERFDEDKAVYARVVSRCPLQNESFLRITVYQALPKGDKLDTVIQKSVECGAVGIVPFESEYCIVRAKSEGEDKKQQRRARIAQEAAKQCGRGILPTVERTLSFAQMLSRAKQADVALLCYEGKGTVSIKSALQQQRELGRLTPDRTWTVAVIVGSEGGFSCAEVEKAMQAGCVAIGLGSRILRTETASCVALSCLMYEFEL